MEAVGQDVQAAKDFILSALPKAYESVSESRLLFDFLASPVRILGDASGQVQGLEVEETKLIPFNGDTKARGTGIKRNLDVDTVIFCIGDKVDETFGLPVQWNEFVKNPNPSYPVNGISHEVFDAQTGQPIQGIFVAGWSREASAGLVGVARKDGESGAQAMLQYLQTMPALENPTAVADNVNKLLQKISKPIITKANILRLEAVEQSEAERRNLDEFKFGSNEEMLAAIGSG